jgi:hypothetical protein
VNYVEDNTSDDVTIRRNKIAQDMWESYQRVLEDRGDNEEDNDDDDNLTEETFCEDDNFIMI